MKKTRINLSLKIIGQLNSELWGQTGHKGRCSGDFVYFPQLASQRGLCAWDSGQRRGRVPSLQMRQHQETRSLWYVVSLGWRQGAAIYSLSWTCLISSFNLLISWAGLQLSCIHYILILRPMHDQWLLMIIWKVVTINTNNHSRNFS